MSSMGWRCLFLCLPALAAMAAKSDVVWLTGPALASRLAQTNDVRWSTVPLRQAIAGLARETRVAMLLDRRIDPSQRVSLVQTDQTLARVLDELAYRSGLGRATLGSAVYFGPPAAAARLTTLADLRREEAKRQGGNVESRLVRHRALRWDELAVPRDLVSQLAQENDFAVAGLERVPHDLWPAGELPAMTLGDRLTLLLNQFDLTFAIEPDGKTLRLAPVPADLVIRAKPDETGQSRPKEKTHKPVRPPAGGEKRYTLRQAKGQLGDLVTKLAAMLQLELKMDRERLKQAGVRLEQPVSLSVQEATVDELFEQLLKPAGCTFRREGQVLEVLPATRDSAK